jgi:SAM-dependent methyltransferase
MRTIARKTIRRIVIIARPAYVSVRDWLTKLAERHYHIRTSDIIELDELGIAAPDRIRHKPTPWFALRRALPPRSVGPDDVFIDLGSGMGRVAFQAALRYPFKRVIGVELSRKLHETAVENIAQNRDRLRCRDVQLVCSDVLHYDIPDDVTVVFLNNPFTGEIFAVAIDRLLASIDRRPRHVRVVYFNPIEHERIMRTGRAQLVKRVGGLRRTVNGRGPMRRMCTPCCPTTRGRSLSPDRCN